jgi:predicted lipoprotein
MKKVLIIVFSIALLFSCGDNDSPGETKNDFDRTALLTNWADNIIIPSYTNYQTKVTSLNTSIANFNANPTEANLLIVRNDWKAAYLAYQYVAIYNVGKAEEISFKESTNTYPTDVAGITTNIQSNSYNLELLSQYSKQGFPAVDYVINGLASTDAAIVAFYVTNTNATNYKQYLAALGLRLKSNADAIVTNWTQSYRNTFVADNGTSVSSSVNRITNNFVKSFEKDVRAGKVGIPAGVYSSGTLFPEKTEAYYVTGFSKELLTASIQASQDFFNGKYFASATTGSSLKSYLDYVNAVRNNQKLSDIINNQFATIFTTNNALNNSLSQQVINDNSKMISSFDALQQNVIYLKLDMMQALNITIDYVDGDGD